MSLQFILPTTYTNKMYHIFMQVKEEHGLHVRWLSQHEFIVMLYEHGNVMEMTYYVHNKHFFKNVIMGMKKFI